MSRSRLLRELGAHESSPRIVSPSCFVSQVMIGRQAVASRLVTERDVQSSKNELCGKKGGVGTYGYGECVRSVEYSLLPVSVLFSSAHVR